MSKADSFLWKRFLDGDNEAYAAIYREHVQAIYSFGRCFTQDHELVKDCIQEMFLKLGDTRHKLNTTDKIRPYLLVIFRNILFNSLKSQKNNTNIDELENLIKSNLSTDHEILDMEEMKHKAKKVTLLLSTLSNKQREVIHYRYVEGLSISQIADILEIKSQSIQNVLQRAIRKMREKSAEF